MLSLPSRHDTYLYLCMLVYSTLHLLVTDILKEVKSHVLRFYLSELSGVISSTKSLKKVINFDMIIRMPIITY